MSFVHARDFNLDWSSPVSDSFKSVLNFKQLVQSDKTSTGQRNPLCLIYLQQMVLTMLSNDEYHIQQANKTGYSVCGFVCVCVYVQPHL